MKNLSTLPKNQQYILDKLKEGCNLHFSEYGWELKFKGKKQLGLIDGRSAKAIISKGMAVQVPNTTEKIYTFPYQKITPTKTKPKHHEIELSELQKFIEEEDVTFARSTRENKRITVSLNGTIKVFAAYKLIYQGMQPFPAVEAYNAVTEKYVDESLKNFKL